MSNTTTNGTKLHANFTKFLSKNTSEQENSADSIGWII